MMATFARRPSATPVAPLAALLLGFSVLLPLPAQALDLSRPDIREFIAELAETEGVDRQYLESVLGGAVSEQSILDAMSRPAEKVKPWHEYREIFLTPRRISAGVDFFREHEARLTRVSSRTGVPAEIIAAILGVETFYGTRTGSYRVVNALATLGFDYPPRAAFFRSELRHLFLLAREERIDLASLTGSYAGAMGPPQFIPSSYRAFAVDGDGDGRRDLLRNWDDITASIANYFVAHDWLAGQPIATPARLTGDLRPPANNDLVLRDTVASLRRQGADFSTDLADTAPAMLISLEGRDGPEYWVGFQNFYAITRYNRSAMYALAVFQLSQAIANGANRETQPVLR